MDDKDWKKVGQVIFDLFSYVLAIFVVIAAFYFILSDDFNVWRHFLALIAPVALFFIPVVFSFKHWLKLPERETINATLFITDGDIIVMDIIMYAAPATILFLAALSQEINLMDIVQALTACFFILVWKTYLLKRAKQ